LEQLAASLENLSDICKVLRKLNIPLISLKEEIKTCAYSSGKNLCENNQKVGYAHAYSGDSSCGLQKKVLQHEACGKIFNSFSDEFDNERKELVKAVKYAEKIKADSLVVCNIKRLAGSLENLSDICNVFKCLGISLICIEQDIVIIPKTHDFMQQNRKQEYLQYKENTTKEIIKPNKEKSKKKELPDNKKKIGKKKVLIDIEEKGFEDISFGLAELKEKTSKIIEKKHRRRTILYLIKIIICILLIFGILGWVYYCLLTKYDNEELSESEYLAIKKSS
jgi:DNA invertase Pin-like site-specific DNA recombinase